MAAAKAVRAVGWAVASVEAVLVGAGASLAKVVALVVALARAEAKAVDPAGLARLEALAIPAEAPETAL